MMLGVSGLMGSSGDGAAAAEAHESGGASGGSSEVGGASCSIPMEESGGGGGGGNRWPRQETLALLKVRSDMDVAFRDSSLKGPLWEEVSRKLAELGFQRSAKKCKEKFENVYKYHKRTKDGRTSKPDGKSYRFFDQLAALETTPPVSLTPPPHPQPPPPAATAMAAPPVSSVPPNITVSSPTPLTVIPPNPNNQISSSIFQNSQPVISTSIPAQNHNFPTSNPLVYSTSSSTSSDEDIQRRRGSKRKWRDYFERLMKDVVYKQEELQKQFLDTLEKRERERAAREEAWRVQETARLNREHELLVQERSMAAAKDTAVIAFLQKVTTQQTLQIPTSNHTSTIAIAPPQAAPMQVRPPPENPQTPRQPPPAPAPPPQQQQQQTALPPPPAPPVLTPEKSSKTDSGGGDNFLPASSSRWPKAEIQALINLRTSLDLKYQDNSPKGPLWEEISSLMAKLGYNRNAKRCKEKWENINKYYKKVKESSKKRPEDSKTCPYFHQLDAIYKDKAKNDVHHGLKPDNPMVPIMARPEQQWPMPDHQQQQQQQQNEDMVMHDDLDHDNESENNDDGEDEDEDEGGNYEIIENKQPSSGTIAV